MKKDERFLVQLLGLNVTHTSLITQGKLIIYLPKFRLKVQNTMTKTKNENLGLGLKECSVDEVERYYNTLSFD